MNAFLPNYINGKTTVYKLLIVTNNTVFDILCTGLLFAQDY